MIPIPVNIPWKLVGAAALALVIASGCATAAWKVQGLRLDAVRADLRTANDRIAFINAANKQCAVDVQDARAAVDALKDAAAERERTAAAAVAAAEAAAAVSDKRAADLAARKPASQNDCQAADMFTADYFKGRGK